MRLLTARRMPPDEQVRAARARVTALRRRTGWVPRVPDRARGPQRLADPGGAVAAGEPAPDAQGTFGGQATPGGQGTSGQQSTPVQRGTPSLRGTRGLRGTPGGQGAPGQRGTPGGQGAPGLRRGPGRHAKPPDGPPDEAVDGLPDGPPDGPPDEAVDGLPDGPPDGLPDEPGVGLPGKPVDGPPGKPVDGGPHEPVDGAPGVSVAEPSHEPVAEPSDPRREKQVRQPSGEPDAPDSRGPRGPVAAAVADRLPLAVRPLVESLPAGVRRGRLGLQPSHALIIVLIVLLGLAVTALLAGLGRPKVSAVQPAATATVLATGTPVAEPEPEPGTDSGAPARESTVVVHVVGKVASPGIVELPAGSRVVDALEAVGGPDDGVDLSTLNLARVVGDGEQVFVGVDPPPQAVPPAEPGDGTPTRVNLNTATADQLETLPGIGPTLAGRILEWRERNGRFTAPEELLEVSGIGPATFEAMADLVTL